MIGNLLTETLTNIESALWEFEYKKPGVRYNYTNEGIRASAKIFTTALLDAAVKKLDKEGIEGEDRVKQIKALAGEIRALTLKYTDLDLHKMHK